MTTFEFTHQHIPVGESLLHIVEAGQNHPDSLVFLHGWPEDWTEWRRVMELASKTHHVVALDLPGVGESHGMVPGGEKATLAETIHQAVLVLGLDPYVIVGHDAGAMVAYAYLRKFPAEIKAAVLLSSVIPGIEPWSKVLANPFIWHFAFHSTPKLPEILVMGKQLAEQHYQQVRVTVQAMLRRGMKPQEIAVPVVAKEAGVSVATIYRRADLFAIVQRANPTIQRRQAEQVYQKTIEQLQEELKKARTDIEYYQKEAQMAKLGERRPSQEVMQLKKTVLALQRQVAFLEHQQVQCPCKKNLDHE